MCLIRLSHICHIFGAKMCSYLADFVPDCQISSMSMMIIIKIIITHVIIIVIIISKKKIPSVIGELNHVSSIASVIDQGGDTVEVNLKLGPK